MGAPVLNTRFIGNGSMRQAKSPMATPQSGGLHDVYAHGQKMYGTAMQAYAGYQTLRGMYDTYQAVRPMIQAGLAL